MLSSDEVMSRLQTVIRRTFSDPGAVVTRDTVAADVKGWDSISHTSLILDIEDEFSVEFDVETMLDLQNVGELADAIMKTAP
jgi:acyl carrier protein